jgi:large subunit ribosomal protein L10
LPTPQKEQAVDELRGLMGEIQSMLLVDYRGLRVSEIGELRRRLRDIGAQLMVVKNRLLSIAIAETPKAVLGDHLVGPTAVAFGEDPAAVAKVLSEFARAFPSLELKPGFVEGQILSADQINELARLPSRSQLLALVVGAMNSPIAGLAYTLRSIISELTLTLHSLVQQRTEAEAAA